MTTDKNHRNNNNDDDDNDKVGISYMARKSQLTVYEPPHLILTFYR